MNLELNYIVQNILYNFNLLNTIIYINNNNYIIIIILYIHNPI